MSEDQNPDPYSPELQVKLAGHLLEGAIAMQEKVARTPSASTIDSARRTDALGLFKKSIYHFGSITTLLSGTTLSPEVQVYDYHSIGALTRDLFENALLLAYVVCGKNVPDDERAYRHDAWRLTGFRQRWEMVESADHPVEHARDKSEMDRLRKELTNNAYVQSLKETQRPAAIERGQWNLIAGRPKDKLVWGEMVEVLGYKRKYFDRAYTDLSRYLHSTSTSAFEAVQMSPDQEKDNAGRCFPRALMALSIATAEFGGIFPVAEAEFAQDEDAVALRTAYLNVAKNVKTT